MTVFVGLNFLLVGIGNRPAIDKDLIPSEASKLRIINELSAVQYVYQLPAGYPIDKKVVELKNIWLNSGYIQCRGHGYNQWETFSAYDNHQQKSVEINRIIHYFYHPIEKRKVFFFASQNSEDAYDIFYRDIQINTAQYSILKLFLKLQCD
ncbi:hypothetical protein [Ostreibacterium oceani]|uniref:Uncharacterized protein n=1 Tax=Ostreibacterium oceani TaxID=2654998 RepID=A0A6N7EY47_9GAMM|nr:hypothetical protein [Ostreibacterium oceani]MPV86873.1 hypothetical protein [Ostreibacterium oceani]